jgi:PTS system ascorbate-specific IIA component
MIEGFVLTEDLIEFLPGAFSWQDAIRASGKPLVEKGFIQSAYVDAMIDVVATYGPYIVIAPMIAMPHARPEAGSIKVGFAVSIFETPVAFGDTEELNAKLFVTLSCTSSDTHLQMMQALIDVLGDEEKVQTLLTTKDKSVVLELFH